MCSTVWLSELKLNNYHMEKTLAVKSLAKRLLQRIGKKTLANVDLHHQSPIND